MMNFKKLHFIKKKKIFFYGYHIFIEENLFDEYSNIVFIYYMYLLLIHHVI